jgi:acetylornithine deacetylase/succinyl-diaminopimelate desuccinylase-like protein
LKTGEFRTMATTTSALKAADRGFAHSLDSLMALLRFPSVGTDPAHAGDCRAAAEWLRQRLESMGFAAELKATTGQPVVLGRLAAKGLPRGAPHILFYGHYDVQPADPLALWKSPPFEPQLRKGRDGRKSIFGRGASDDKGQLMTFLEAVRFWLGTEGSLPFRLTVLLEGDEEGDSGHLDRFLQRHRRDLKADAAFICDTDLWDDDTPGINTMLRGCIAEEVRINGPRIDLHSGYYGGPAVNPIKVLSRILAELHDGNGRVTIPGFYDGVRPPPAALRRQWARLKFPARRFLGNVGLSQPAGEKGFTVLEQLWARPTAEVNGIWGGYRGPGSKTVLPAEANAKLTFRLVQGQDPRRLRKAFRDFVRKRLPSDCMASFASQGGNSSGVSVEENSPWIAAARRALKEEWGKAAVLMGGGGSIPVVESFKKHLGIDSLLVGFARENDCIHSPNEKYDVDCYRRGIRSWIRIIGELS